MAWAFAKVGQSDEKLLAVLALAVGRRVSDFNAQSLANTAWAFAQVGQLDEKLFAVLAMAAERHVCVFNKQGLSA